MMQYFTTNLLSGTQGIQNWLHRDEVQQYFLHVFVSDKTE